MKPCRTFATTALFLAIVISSPLVSAQTKIGALLPMSGKYGTLGANVLQSIELAAQETGLTVVVADSASKNSTIADEMERLVKTENVTAIIGPIGSKNSEIAAKLAQGYKVPLFTLGSDKKINQLSPWVFRVRASPEEQATELATVAIKDLKLRRAAVMYPQNEYGTRATIAFVKRFVALGGVVTGMGSYDEELTDFTFPLKEITGRMAFVGKKQKVGKKKANRDGYVKLRGKGNVDFDALFIPDFSYRVARLLPFLPLVGMQNGEGGDGIAVQLLGLSGWQGKTMELAGSVAAGGMYLDTFAGDVDGGRAEEFVRTFENAAGRPPEDIDAETFDIVWMLGKIAKQKIAVKTPVDAARKKLVANLPFRTTWEGITGALQFAPDGSPIRQFNVYRFDTNGEVSPAY